MMQWVTFFFIENLKKGKELQYPFTRNIIDDVYQDIQNANLYKELEKKKMISFLPQEM